MVRSPQLFFHRNITDMTEHLVANYDDLSDGEMKEISISGKGKVLLSRINGEYFATSHLCPHYKAPLAKGVISSDGRVMCPWHGACFRVQTGDIEDAPSVEGLSSFPVVVKGSKVFVKLSDEGNLWHNNRTQSFKKAAQMHKEDTIFKVKGCYRRRRYKILN
jgi:nitrite reductase/ring-hydroxylating ferredoxin subunit